jgi:hypothetical protein
LNKKAAHMGGNNFPDKTAYAGLDASVGQTEAQVPQSEHFVGSITYFESPSEIAPSGHSVSHAPQEMQSSDITYAITNPFK